MESPAVKTVVDPTVIQLFATRLKAHTADSMDSDNETIPTENGRENQICPTLDETRAMPPSKRIRQLHRFIRMGNTSTAGRCVKLSHVEFYVSARCE